MNEILNDPFVQQFLSDLSHEHITLFTGLMWLSVATLMSIVGGAIGGALLAGQDLGYRLAAMIGGLFGPAAMIPAAIASLVFLRFA